MLNCIVGINHDLTEGNTLKLDCFIYKYVDRLALISFDCKNIINENMVIKSKLVRYSIVHELLRFYLTQFTRFS